ncbi:MAG: ArsC family transcriptional regulator [Hyphomonadaceae bacterium]|nr:ArsC family transcriptional regulator [Hyphomonadaceae bacterium]
MILYGLKNCDTCKKALKALESAGKPADFVDIRTDADLSTKVPAWLEAAGEKLLNKASTTWRNLPEEQRTKAESDPASLLIANPTLIKRPVIETGGEIYVGWKKDVQAALV